MQSTVETLNPTRVRLTVEVPFEELKPSLDAAYEKIAQQVALPGFRRGKVPPRLIDQRFGRGVVLEEAVNEAVPQFYSQAVQENEIVVLSQPQVDVTEFADNSDLKFTAEVDVRPEVELPEFESISVTVPDAVVSDADVDEQVQGLRERFGTLTGVDRAVQDGDFLSIDLHATTQDGQEIEDGTASGLSYQVGSGSMLPGLDEAVIGLEVDGERTFSTALVGGDRIGEDADVTVTVRSVKERELPELDDEFAQTASEFDTVEELRADVVERLGRVRRLEQGAKARDLVLDQLLERADPPVPENVVEAEVHRHLEGENRLDDSEHETEVRESTRRSLRAQFVLDAIVEKEQVEAAQDEVTQHLLQRAAQSGLPPEQFAQQVVQSGQVPLLVNEVRQGKALALVLEAATITDESGNRVDLGALAEDGSIEPVGDEDEVEVPAEDEVETPLAMADVESAAETADEAGSGSDQADPGEAPEQS